MGLKRSYTSLLMLPAWHKRRAIRFFPGVRRKPYKFAACNL